MRPHSIFSLLMTSLALPSGHGLQPLTGQEIFSWNQFTSFDQHVCPSTNVELFHHNTQGRRTPHDRDDVDRRKSDIWITSPDCFNEYCIYTNNEFHGKGISLVTTMPNYHRVAEVQMLNPFSGPNYGKIRVAQIPGKGRGLIATQYIQHGERIMAERPALLVHRNIFIDLELKDIYYMLDMAVDNLKTPRRESYFAQAGTMGGHKVTDILFTNSYQMSLGDADGGFHYGVFPEVSLLNHDCRPNLAFYIDSNMTHATHAVRDIKAGEELTISYVDSLQVRSIRQERTRSSLGFACGCSHCTLPRTESEASDTRLLSISRIETELSDFKSRNVSSAKLEEYMTLHRQERLDSKMAGPYTLSALNYNMLGNTTMSKKYALLSVEAGLLESGPGTPDVQEMRILAGEPKSHWSWNMKKRPL